MRRAAIHRQTDTEPVLNGAELVVQRGAFQRSGRSPGSPLLHVAKFDEEFLGPARVMQDRVEEAVRGS